MMEILTSLWLLGGIGAVQGKIPRQSLLPGDLREPFNFNDIYDRQRELFRRKPCNLTKTLDALKAALIKEYRKRNAKEGKSTGDKNKNGGR